MTSFLSASTALATRTYSVEDSVFITQEHAEVMMEALAAMEQEKLSAADVVTNILKVFKTPSFTLELQPPNLPSTIEKFHVKIPSTSFAVALPGRSSWTLTVSGVDADLAKVTHYPVELSLEATSGHLTDVGAGVKGDLEAGQVTFSTESESESLIAYTLGRQHHVEVVETRYDVHRHLKAGEEAGQSSLASLKSLELDLDGLAGMSLYLDHSSNTVSVSVGGTRASFEASVLPARRVMSQEVSPTPHPTAALHLAPKRPLPSLASGL